MTDKELRRLSRVELVQLLLEQTRETERLQKELDEAREELNNRRVLISNAGSLAEATVQLNRLMETAQATADQYVENVRQECADALAETQRKMAQLEQTTKRRCAQLVQEAKKEAGTYGGGA